MFGVKREVNVGIDKEYFLSMLAGSETGLSTTTAVILGLSSLTSISVIINVALLSISVQAFNAAAGRYSSLRTSKEIEHEEQKQPRLPLTNAVLQFITYVISGLIPLVPILIFDFSYAFIGSVLVSLISLAFIGYWKGSRLKKNNFAHTAEVILLGSLVMVVGLTAGLVVEQFR